METENKLSEEVTGVAIEVHRELGGPGLMESVYEEALVCELLARGLEVERQKEVRLNYKSHELSTSLRLDRLVNASLVVAVKAVAELNPVCRHQVRTYRRLLNLRLGLIINFGQPKLVDGVKRVINNTLCAPRLCV